MYNKSCKSDPAACKDVKICYGRLGLEGQKGLNPLIVTVFASGVMSTAGWKLISCGLSYMTYHLGPLCFAKKTHVANCLAAWHIHPRIRREINSPLTSLTGKPEPSEKQIFVRTGADYCVVFALLTDLCTKNLDSVHIESV